MQVKHLSWGFICIEKAGEKEKERRGWGGGREIEREREGGEGRKDNGEPRSCPPEAGRHDISKNKNGYWSAFVSFHTFCL